MTNFNTAPNKKAKLVLETTAFKQSRSDLNVAFSSADRETGVFEFTVTQDNKPLLLGNDNVKSSIIFVHSNGLKIKAPMVITDGLNGKISYQVPNDILKTPGKVTSQVYVARKSKEETHAVVAERIFSFEIEKSLAWEFDAETKLNYIIEFDELEAQIKQRIYAIEQAMSNAEDYVNLIEQAKEKGLSDIDMLRANSIEELTTLANNKLAEINSKGNEYVEDLTIVRDGIDDKINQFNSDVNFGGYTRDTATSNWQKYKLTNEDGSRFYTKKADFKHINDLPIGFHETISGDDPVSQGLPADIKASYVEIDVMAGKSDSERKQYRVTKSYDNRTWVKTIHTDGVENEWKEITIPIKSENVESIYGSQEKADKALLEAKAYIDANIYDTGWQDLPLMSGFEQDYTLGPSVYRIKNDICTVIFNTKVKSSILSSGSPIFNLPSNYSPKYSFSFLARTNGSSGQNPVKCSYDMIKKEFKVWENNDNSLKTGNFVYGQLTFIVG
ncbi:BppU family phage baseplate upper protein [Mammaliicoccus sp. N-M51]|uniref:BppU family phage baseplate upper protein n=1 Tax=Mammaliicoccus sp. N-M51 TaxID=2898710 RepID=UPI001EFA6234|nr:BppU family phage baseplate upper protein [Mammaliicoccus sp. N-M51]